MASVPKRDPGPPRCDTEGGGEGACLAVGGVPPPLDGASSPRLRCHRTWSDSGGDSHPCVASPTPAPQKSLPQVGWDKGAEGLDTPPPPFSYPLFLEGGGGCGCPFRAPELGTSWGGSLKSG